MLERDISCIRDKIFNGLTLENLNKDNGVNMLITYMNNLFQKDELSELYERYVVFDRYVRQPKIKMSDYILEYERPMQ